MKKFKYGLETVLNYKTQVLDDLRTQHAVIVQNVHRKQEEIKKLNEELDELGNDFDKTKSAGTSIEMFRLYDMCIERFETIIDQEEERLDQLKQAENEKKKEVITAKVDTSKYEKLKEKKLREYHKAALKAEEAYIEEFVSHAAIRRR